MKPYALALLLAALSAPLPLYAQDSLPALEAPAPAPPAAPAEEPKSGLTALGLSLGGTALGVAASIQGVRALAGDEVNLGQSVVFSVLGLSLVTVGPSFGHIYTGTSRHAVILTSARLLSFGVPFILSQRSIAGGGTGEGAAILSGVGGLAFGGLVLYDLIDAPRSARRVNRREPATSLRLSPTLLPSAGSSQAAGAMASFRF
jgi:hypothetical protein